MSSNHKVYILALSSLFLSSTNAFHQLSHGIEPNTVMAKAMKSNNILPHPNHYSKRVLNLKISSTQLYSKGKARFSSSSVSSTGTTSTTTSILDSLLTFFSSDFGGVVLGALGLILCLANRLTHLDYVDASAVQVVDEVGRQSRSDLLAVFATMAVFLNGVSKLDVTSALAESVVLDGVMVSSDSCSFLDAIGDDSKLKKGEIKEKVNWAIMSVLEATPAKTAMLMQYKPEENKWTPIAFGGVVTEEMKVASQGNIEILSSVMNVKTPIIDRFVLDANKQRLRKESYLPTLQALPGKTEFTYLPVNTQEALLLPVYMPNEGDADDVAVSVLVLGSDTAKSFSPRDVAWCQVLAARIGGFLD